jgi:hypothetical protein
MRCELLSEFGVKVEEGVEALLELGFDLLAGAFEDVHGYVGFIAVGQLEGCVLNLLHFALWEEAHSVHKSQICHVFHLITGVLSNSYE